MLEIKFILLLIGCAVVLIISPVLCLFYIKKFKYYVIWLSIFTYSALWLQTNHIEAGYSGQSIGSDILFFHFCCILIKTVIFIVKFASMPNEQIFNLMKKRSTIKFSFVFIAIFVTYLFVNQNGMCIADFKKYTENELVFKTYLNTPPEDYDKIFLKFNKFRKNYLGESRLFVTTYFEYFDKTHNKISYIEYGRLLDGCGNGVGRTYKTSQGEELFYKQIREHTITLNQLSTKVKNQNN